MSSCDCSYDTWDDYLPAVCRTSWHIARKQHTCCECGLSIAPGERYERVEGCWEGTWSTFKTCDPCARIRKDYCASGWIYGELRDTLWECLGIDYITGEVADWAAKEDEHGSAQDHQAQ